MHEILSNVAFFFEFRRRISMLIILVPAIIDWLRDAFFILFFNVIDPIEKDADADYCVAVCYGKSRLQRSRQKGGRQPS